MSIRPRPRPAARVKPSAGDLDRELLLRFRWAGKIRLLELFDRLEPKWAAESLARLAARGHLAEDQYTRRVTVTPAGREELDRGV